jgi:plasmid stabilization system protein ParE
VKVRYSSRALLDLAEIGDYLAERSPTGARAVEHAIRRTVLLIADFPGSGRAVEQRRDARVLPVLGYPYLIFYTVRADTVFVLHVRHAKRAAPERL